MENTKPDNTIYLFHRGSFLRAYNVGAWQDNFKWRLYSYNGEGGQTINLSPLYDLGEICNFSSFCLSDDNGYARPEVADGHPKGLDESGTMKVIRNGKLIITKGGKDYSVSGQQLN